MKCAKCGQSLPKNEKICPQCHYDHSLVKRLQEAKIPQELRHLSPDRISHHIQRMHFLVERKFQLLLLGFGLVILAMGYSWFNSQNREGDVHNFHDDIVEVPSTNAGGNIASNWMNGAYVVAYGNDLYVAGKDELYCIPLTLEKKRTATKHHVSGLNIIQDTLYYIDHDAQNKITIVNIPTKERIQSKYSAEQMAVVGNYIYYIDSGYHRNIYQMKTDLSDNRALTQNDCLTFSIVGDWLYYATVDGIYRVPLLGGEVRLLVKGYYPYFNVMDHLIYYLDENGQLLRMKKDGSDQTLLTEDIAGSYVMNNEYIFYTGKEAGIFKYDLKTGIISQLCVDQAIDLQLAGPWIYYRTMDDEVHFVSMDEKSNQVIPLYSIPN